MDSNSLIHRQAQGLKSPGRRVNPQTVLGLWDDPLDLLRKLKGSRKRLRSGVAKQ